MAMEAALVPYARREPMFAIPLPHTERRLMHYSSKQKILLVGEGDFSFSNSLATAFGDARNMIATSLDSQEMVLKKYADDAAFTLSNLKRLGVLLFHQVDATCMAAQTIFCNLVFDRVIYNFPHAGFHGSEGDKKMIRQHKQLVRLFFENAVKLLMLDGEIHVSHKIRPPYTKWKLDKQAAKCGLMLMEAWDFHQADYPGYVNRRGDGNDSASSFHLGKSKTFMFKMRHSPFNPWKELPHILGKRPLDLFQKFFGGRKDVAAAPSQMPHGAPGLPLNIRERAFVTIPIMGPRALLKRKMEEEAYAMSEDIQASKRGCFGFLPLRNHRQPPFTPPPRAQLNFMPSERQMMAPSLPLRLLLGSRAECMLRPLPVQPPPHQHPLLPIFR
ncbi:hypothetical protein GOP47_0020922 [Adiantum capillus-veneris]|uniref:25S rRNA (uridine-N(3))-methyltransferase BMT5-like domain-containing protein n=1 Tax=Adiantum capillus-veneris TaxID=13818 RepID=A0A9D4Z868_ADICA|nr:hypothetical protein GOP47_0020922 [Adiantum capillus-veneris]